MNDRLPLMKNYNLLCNMCLEMLSFVRIWKRPRKQNFLFLFIVQVTFNEGVNVRIVILDGVNVRSVTLDGDSFDPSGTLEGGSREREVTTLSMLHVLIL